MHLALSLGGRTVGYGRNAAVRMNAKRFQRRTGRFLTQLRCSRQNKQYRGLCRPRKHKPTETARYALREQQTNVRSPQTTSGRSL
jgi:hypothetical protein